MTPQEYMTELDAQVGQIATARDALRVLINVAPYINNAAETQLKNYIRDKVQDAATAITDLVLS